MGLSHDVLTLAILAVLVASCDRVHTVAGGAVGRRAVGLRWSQAFYCLHGLWALTAASWDRVGSLKSGVQGRDGEVVLRLRSHGAWVTQDAHNLQEWQIWHTINRTPNFQLFTGYYNKLTRYKVSALERVKWKHNSSLSRHPEGVFSSLKTAVRVNNTKG